MTVKVLATAVAAVAAIGASVITGVAAGEPVAVQVQPAVFGAPFPLPLDPPPSPAASDVPTAEQLTNLLTNMANPAVSYHDKDILVENGIDPGMGHELDHALRKASRHGDLPLSFTVDNIQPAGPNAASADVTANGPKLPAPITKNMTFVNQNGWVISHDSATALVQEAAGR